MLKMVAVIPCYNHPKTIGQMVDAVRAQGLMVVVVDDGSDAACANVLDQLAVQHGAAMSLVRLPVNQGKGGAVSAGLRHALAQGYTHALQIDADAQHDVTDLAQFLATSANHPQAVICGHPIYDASVPKGRQYARYLTHVWVWINTLSFDIRDAMCGYRVYPLVPVVGLINQVKIGQRMDFEVELLVRLHWRSVRMVNLSTRVIYPEDGLSHFQVIRDNVLISRMHARLFFGMLIRMPWLLWRKVF